MCISPVPLKNQTAKYSFNKAFSGEISDMQNVPCGKCLECRKTLINSWLFRLEQEFKSPDTLRAWFVTLTYDSLDDNITEDGEITLNYSHFQKFMKRLRKNNKDDNIKIKYYCVGEYGSKTGRPHFHAIMYNVTQEQVLQNWQLGNVHFGDVNEKSIRYTLKYVFKKIGRVYKSSSYVEKDLSRAPERALMSKGLGASYLTPKIINYYQNDITRQITKEGGIIQSLPRYYKQKLYSEGQLQARSRLLQKEILPKLQKQCYHERNAVAVFRARQEDLKEKARENKGD